MLVLFPPLGFVCGFGFVVGFGCGLVLCLGLGLVLGNGLGLGIVHFLGFGLGIGLCLGLGIGLGLGLGIGLGLNRKRRPSNQRFTRVFGSFTSSILLFSAAIKYKEINHFCYFKLTKYGFSQYFRFSNKL